MTTDQGSQFEFQLFTAMTQLIGSKRIHTTAFHPASNGMIERWHRALKAAIMCHQTSEWTTILPTVLLGLRTCYKKDIEGSAAEYMYGTTLRIPGEFFTQEEPPSDPNIFLEEFRIHMRNSKPTPASHHCKNKPFCFKDLYTSSHVFLRQDAPKKGLDQPYSGPHRVIKRLNDRVFTIDINGRTANVSIERLKPAHVATAEILEDIPTQSTSTQQGNQQDDTLQPKPLRTYERPKKTVRIIT